MKINKLVCLCSTVLLGSPILTTTTVIAESIDENGWNQMTPPVGGQTEPNTLLESKDNIPIEGNLETSSSVSETGEEETSTSSTDNKEEANESNSSIEEAVVPSDSAETVSSEEKTKNATTAKATTLADWAITVSGTDAEITGYVGSDADRVIPTLEDLKAADPATYGSCTQAVIGYSGLNGAAKNATSLSMSTNGSKVKVKGTSLNSTFAMNSTIKSMNLNNLDTSNVTDMGQMFEMCSSLTSLDVSNFNTSKVTNLGNNTNDYISSDIDGIFSGCRSLTSLDVSNWDTSNVTNMVGVFRGCSNLTSLDISKWNTSNVVNMQNMFESCEVTSLDVSNWDTSNVRIMQSMFMWMNNLISLDLSNWNMKNVTDMADMFSAGSTSILLLKIDKSNTTLLNYNYLNDRRVPAGPNLDPMGGSFLDGTTQTKSYLDKVALTTEEYAEKEKLDNFKKFIQDNTPTKSGVRFGGWQDAQGNTPDQVTNPLDQLTTIYMAQWKQDPNAPQGSVKPLPNSQELLSLYYLPTQFSIPTTQLNQAGEQIIPFDNGNNFHIGIKDIQSGTSWQLNAQLVWNTPGLETSYIQTKNTTGQVNENQNDGRTDVKDTDFQTTTDVVGEKDVIISETETTIMKSDQTNLNGFYDYALGQADLVIPDAKMIQPNNYKGTVNWNLIQAP